MHGLNEGDIWCWHIIFDYINVILTDGHSQLGNAMTKLPPNYHGHHRGIHIQSCNQVSASYLKFSDFCHSSLPGLNLQAFHLTEFEFMSQKRTHSFRSWVDTLDMDMNFIHSKSICQFRQSWLIDTLRLNLCWLYHVFRLSSICSDTLRLTMRRISARTPWLTSGIPFPLPLSVNMGFQTKVGMIVVLK